MFNEKARLPAQDAEWLHSLMNQETKDLFELVKVKQSGCIRYLLISIKINRVDNTVVVHNDFEVMLHKNKIRKEAGVKIKKRHIHNFFLLILQTAWSGYGVVCVRAACCLSPCCLLTAFSRRQISRRLLLGCCGGVVSLQGG